MITCMYSFCGGLPIFCLAFYAFRRSIDVFPCTVCVVQLSVDNSLSAFSTRFLFRENAEADLMQWAKVMMRDQPKDDKEMSLRS